MNIPIGNMVLDESIQCRKDIDQGVVGEYAERMVEGDSFPEVTLFGTEEQAWPGDGWHRIRAALKVGYESIPATVNPGGRKEALEYALKANGTHGLRRTNADKRRCIEIALREFGDLSSRAIADKCGVGHQLVLQVRQVDEASTSKVTGADGKSYPAKKPETEPNEGSEAPEPQAEPVPSFTLEPVAKRKPKPTAVQAFEALEKRMDSVLAQFERGDADPAEYADIRTLCLSMAGRLESFAARFELEVAHAS